MLHQQEVEVRNESQTNVSELRKLWNKKGRPKLPSEVDGIIKRAQIEFE